MDPIRSEEVSRIRSTEHFDMKFLLLLLVLLLLLLLALLFFEQPPVLTLFSETLEGRSGVAERAWTILERNQFAPSRHPSV